MPNRFPIMGTSTEIDNAAPPLLKASTTIAFGAVRTLNATPVSVIPAPGAGYFIEVESIHAWLDYGSTGYDAVASGDDLSFKYTNASGAKVTGDIAGPTFGDASADAHRVARGVAVTPVGNAAVVAHILATEWFGAAGNSPLKIEAYYRVRPLEF